MIKTPTQLLQVSMLGKPCGWVGLMPTRNHNPSAGVWFHYSSAANDQAWLSLQMPPTINFYEPESFAWWALNHVPSSTIADAMALHLFTFQPNLLDWLALAGHHTEGILSFINPDRPFVPPQVYVEPKTLTTLSSAKAQSLLPHLWARCHSTKHTIHLARTAHKQNGPNTLVYAHTPSSSIEQATAFQNIKLTIDPDNKIHGLRWANTIEFGSHGLLWHRRHDIDANNIERFGLEKAHALLQIKPQHQADWIKQPNAQYWLHELINTYCPKKSLEHKLLEQLWPWLCSGTLEIIVVYRNSPNKLLLNTAIPTVDCATHAMFKPEVLGLDYQWNPWQSVDRQ